jgi:hypothetical protein
LLATAASNSLNVSGLPPLLILSEIAIPIKWKFLRHVFDEITVGYRISIRVASETSEKQPEFAQNFAYLPEMGVKCLLRGKWNEETQNESTVWNNKEKMQRARKTISFPRNVPPWWQTHINIIANVLWYETKVGGNTEKLWGKKQAGTYFTNLLSQRTTVENMGAGASSHLKKLHREILQEAIKRKVIIDVLCHHTFIQILVQILNRGCFNFCGWLRPTPWQDEDEEFLSHPEVAIVLKQQVLSCNSVGALFCKCFESYFHWIALDACCFVQFTFDLARSMIVCGVWILWTKS